MNDKVTPHDLGFPEKFREWRLGQYELIQSITGSSRFLYLLDAPTGTGKSVVGVGVYLSSGLKDEFLSRKFRDDAEITHGTRCVYVTRTKQLQRQILNDYPDAVTLMGRSNYPCLKHPNDFPEVSADDCVKDHGSTCDDRDGCPYYVAKAHALASPLVVLNDAYYFTEVNGPGAFSGAGMVILDEVDSLEGALMSYIEWSVSEEQLGDFGLEPPEDPAFIRSWMEWMVKPALEKVNARVIDAERNLPDKEDVEAWLAIGKEVLRYMKRFKTFQSKLLTFIRDVNPSWVTSSAESKRSGMVWTFKPVLVAPYGHQYLWRHADRFIGMSGTILDPKMLADEVGAGTDYDYKQLSSPFPKKNRPIYYCPEVSLTRERMEAELPRLKSVVSTIIDRYPEGKILVHTVSYKIRDYLMANLPCQSRLLTHSSRDRADKLAEFKDSDLPLVMLSPSFDRGVDLPIIDNCRAVVICKVPYMDLSSIQTRARIRMPGGNQWYMVKTVQTIIQMSGRAVREMEQKCDVWIVDRQFSVLMARAHNYVPQWWGEAIVKTTLGGNE